MGELTVSEQELANRVYIGPSKTGDNIDANRAAGYGFNGSTWQRVPLPLIDLPYDATAFSNPDASGNYQTIIFSASGSTVRTLSLTFDANSNVTSIARS